MPQVSLLELAIYYLIAINFVTFAAFGIDKARAESGGWRVREDTLLTFVTAGGLLGALTGRAAFRHKTRKKSFTDGLWGSAFLSALLFGGGAWWLTRPGPPDRREMAAMERTMASVHYPGCDEVRALGKAPLRYGEPGYRTDMDGDGDGVACEPVP